MTMLKIQLIHLLVIGMTASGCAQILGISELDVGALVDAQPRETLSDSRSGGGGGEDSVGGIHDALVEPPPGITDATNEPIYITSGELAVGHQQSCGICRSSSCKFFLLARPTWL